MFSIRMLSVGLVTMILGLIAALPVAAQKLQFPLEQQKSNVTVRLTRARWASPREVNYMPFYADPSKRVFVVEYEIERPEAAEKDQVMLRRRLFTTGAIARSSGEFRLQGPVARGRWIFDEVDPRAKRIVIECEVPRPNAPPAANGVSEEILDFGTLPIPAPDAGPLEIKKQQKTTLGTTVEIERAQWQTFERRTVVNNARGEKEAKASPMRGLRLVTRVVPPGTPVTKSTVRLEHGLVTDAAGKSLNPPQFYYGNNTTIAGDRQERIELFVTEEAVSQEASLKEVHVKIKVREDAPSRRLPEWAPIFRFAINPSDVPSAISSTEPAPPLAQSEFEGGVVELDGLRPQTFGTAGLWRIRLRTRSTLLSGENTPPWVWTPDIRQARDDTGQEWTYNFNSEPIYFHPDGAPLRAGEYGTGILYRSGTAPTAAKTLDLKVRLIAHRRITPEDFKNISLPREPGQVLPLREVREDKSGAKLILWKIGAFDNAHPTALTAPGMNQSSEPGIALVFEYRPIPDGAKLDRVTLGEPVVHDQNGAVLPTGVRFGEDKNSGKYPTANGDLLKAGQESGHWFTVFLPPPPSEVKTLDVAMQVFERQSPDTGPVVEWKAIPIPTPGKQP